MALVVLSIGCRNVASDSSSTSVIELTDESFQREVVEARQPVLVEFWAPWCKPCLEMEPEIEQLADELSGRVKVARLNIAGAPDTAASVDVSAPPVFILFRDGEVVKRRSGKQTKSALRELISDAFNVTPFVPRREALEVQL